MWWSWASRLPFWMQGCSNLHIWWFLICLGWAHLISCPPHFSCRGTSTCYAKHSSFYVFGGRPINHQWWSAIYGAIHLLQNISSKKQKLATSTFKPASLSGDLGTSINHESLHINIKHSWADQEHQHIMRASSPSTAAWLEDIYCHHATIMHLDLWVSKWQGSESSGGSPRHPIREGRESNIMWWYIWAPRAPLCAIWGAYHQHQNFCNTKKILRGINFRKNYKKYFQRWSRIWPLLFGFCAISTRLPEERMGVTKKKSAPQRTLIKITKKNTKKNREGN